MATRAVTEELLRDLRRRIAAIEDETPRLRQVEAETPSHGENATGGTLLREHGRPVEGLRHARAERVSTGDGSADRLLGGGLPLAALSEVIAPETRDAGAAAALALGLALRAHRARKTGAPQAPLLWATTRQAMAEAGMPWAPGLAGLLGLEPHRLLVAEVPRLADLLWIAGEAAPLAGLSAVIVEMRGNPAACDLTATRRLHMRARQAGRPVILLRQAARAEASAALLRLLVRAAPSAPASAFGVMIEGTIGNPAFCLTVDKGANETCDLTLEWNRDDQRFVLHPGAPLRRKPVQRPPYPGAVVSLPAHRPDSGRPPRPDLTDQHVRRRG
ncbi:MAG: hypothetical protein R3D65_18550 [Zhengella sp.]|uniref:hypothetical protein n=1 Tax=Zhengella sp. TaxID=2282762 RepID=UPI003528B130